MLTSVLPTEVTHSSLDLFEKPAVQVAFEQGFEQKIGSSSSTENGVVEFSVIGDRQNFIDLESFKYEMVISVQQANGNPLRYHATDKDASDEPKLVNNICHSLFKEADVTFNTVKVSSANGMYGHKCFIETEFSHTINAKKTRLRCNGYNYEQEPGNAAHADIAGREELTRTSQRCRVIGKIPVDVFTCDKLLLPGVAVRLRLVKASDDFLIISDDNDKHYKVVIHEAYLYVRKLRVTEAVIMAIEKTLLTHPAMYKYTEMVSRSLLIGNGVRTFVDDKVFQNEPIRRMAVVMNTNAAFNDSNRYNPYHYQKFNLTEITVLVNGTPAVGTPLDTVDNKRAYISTLDALAYGPSESHGIPLDEYENHYVLVFDFTSTQEASHDFIHPELTGSTIALHMKFGANTPEPIEVFVLAEKASTIFIDSDRKVSKNALIGA